MNALQRPPLQPWYGQRITVPVMSASGGVGRSTVAAAIAAALTVCVGEVAVVDTAPRGSSPWPNWVAQPPGGGTPLLAWHRQQGAAPFSRETVAQAASWFVGAARVAVFTDTGHWQSPVAECDERPAWWSGATDAYRGVVVDGPSDLLTDLFRTAGGQSRALLQQWFGQPGDVVPVLVTGWSQDAVTALSASLSLLESSGLPAGRAVVAAVNQSESAPPPSVLAVLTALAGRGIAVVNLPFESSFRAAGARTVGQSQPGFQVAITDLVNAVLARTAVPPGTPPPGAPGPVGGPWGGYQTGPSAPPGFGQPVPAGAPRPLGPRPGTPPYGTPPPGTTGAFGAAPVPPGAPIAGVPMPGMPAPPSPSPPSPSMAAPPMPGAPLSSAAYYNAPYPGASSPGAFVPTSPGQWGSAQAAGAVQAPAQPAQPAPAAPSVMPDPVTPDPVTADPMTAEPMTPGPGIGDPGTPDSGTPDSGAGDVEAPAREETVRLSSPPPQLGLDSLRESDEGEDAGAPRIIGRVTPPGDRSDRD